MVPAERAGRPLRPAAEPAQQRRGTVTPAAPKQSIAVTVAAARPQPQAFVKIPPRTVQNFNMHIEALDRANILHSLLKGELHDALRQAALRAAY
jgi:hypothetical protein